MDKQNGEYFYRFIKNNEYIKCKSFKEMFNFCPFAKPHGFANVKGLEKCKKLNNKLTKKILTSQNIDIETYKNIDFVSSNHFIASIHLINELTNMKYDMKNLNIIDIGAGYGNIRRILAEYLKINTYTVFDIDCSLHFNELYLKTYDNTYKLFKNKNISEKGFYNIGIDFRDNFNINNLDIVIATHSLSEISYDEFEWYIEHIIKKCDILLYSCQIKETNHNPCCKEIIDKKINILRQLMNIQLEIPQPGEENNCKLFIFKKKYI